MSDDDFLLPGPEYEQIAWVHNDHFTGSVAPLEESLRALTPRRLAADGLPNSIYVCGYGYGRAFEMRAAEGPQDESIVLNWRTHALPAVDAACASLDAFDPNAVVPGTWRDAIVENERLFWDAFRVVHSDTMGQVFPASALWVRLYTERFGEARRADALTMLGGFPNASTQRATALWDLGREARTQPALLADIEAGRRPAPSPDAARFLAGFDRLLEQYGCTTTMHLLDLPTWDDDPATPLRMIAAMAREDDERDPRITEANAAARREALEVDLIRLDDGHDEAVAVLRAVYKVARHLAPASEDHNLLCDQRMIAANHEYWRRIGASLVQGELLLEADDVFYLRLDEAIEALEGQLQPDAVDVAERRARQARWRASSPPATLGLAPEPSAEPMTLRGIAASQGVHRGRARLFASLPDVSDLRPGDVLVCPATSPEWTPYFGVIGALVTGSGGLLTHAAVVAREFGIPAVIGAAGAMTMIPDGATVVVDGTNGIVTIQP